MDKSDEVWRLVNRKYLISQIIQKLHSIRKNKFFCLAVTGDFQLNWRKDEWEWWCLMELLKQWMGGMKLSMNVSAAKIFNESNHKKITCNPGGKLLLPCYYWQCLIEFTKGWMGVMILMESYKRWKRVMQYEGGYIKIM